MFQNELLISVIRQLAADRELSQLSIVLDNVMDEYNDLLELADTEQERDLISLEMKEISDILTYEINSNLNRMNAYIYAESLPTGESDDDEIDNLFDRVQRL